MLPPIYVLFCGFVILIIKSEPIVTLKGVSFTIVLSVQLSQTFPALVGVKFTSLTTVPAELFHLNVTLKGAPCMVVSLSHLNTAEMFAFSLLLYSRSAPVLLNVLFSNRLWRRVNETLSFAVLPPAS